jgi:hypothetical protein
MHHDTTRPREAAICALKHDPAPEAAGQLVGVVSSSVRAQEHRRRHTRVVSKSARLAALDPRPSGTVFSRSAVAALKEGSMFHSKMVFAAGRLALVTAACGDVQARKHVRRNRRRAVDDCADDASDLVYGLARSLPETAIQFLDLDAIGSGCTRDRAHFPIGLGNHYLGPTVQALDYVSVSKWHGRATRRTGERREIHDTIIGPNRGCRCRCARSVERPRRGRSR